METPQAGGEPLSPLDIACLRIEDRTSLIVNAGVMVFAEPVALDQVKTELLQRFLGFHRFRQRLVWPEGVPGRPRWEDDQGFDLDSHVKLVALPAPGDDQALARVIADLVSAPLDRGRPLWQVHLIENHGNGSVLLFRLHHCLADGMALLHVLHAITSQGSRKGRSEALPAGPARQVERGPKPEINPLVAAGLSLLSEIELLLYRGAGTLIELAQARDPVQSVLDAATALGKLLVLGQDTPTVLSGPLGAAKTIAWSAPVPLRGPRAIARSHGSSIRDVLVSAVAGALGRYLQKRGQPVDGVVLRASVPVRTSGGEPARGLGNRFSLNFLALPVNVGDPVERLGLIKRRSSELKASAQADVMSQLMHIYGVAPTGLGNLVLDLSGAKVTAVLSMLPGPRRTVCFAGKPIERLIFWVPQSGHAGLGLSLLAYNGSVTLGVAADAGLVPDPESIARAFERELTEWTTAL